MNSPDNDGRGYLGLFAELFDWIVATLREFSDAALRVDVVPASRKVPCNIDLLHFFMGPSSSKGADWIEPFSMTGPIESYDTRVVDFQESFGIRDVGDPIYRELAKSMAIARVPANEGIRMSHWGEMDRRTVLRVGEQVNRMLTTHLFRERGYSLDADMRLLLSPGDCADLSADKSNNTDNPILVYPMFVRLFLVDPTGRRFSFDEVGSGLGYVLPVLAVLFSSKSSVLIQQPELHLHPALQAELGDVFVEAHQGRSQPIIVETHSEHLLLRILRRIRRTHLGQQQEEELQVRSRDISVLYFDPTPSGVTHVKQLRVSEEGEFMDRWPRGFFAERDQELFDE